MAGGLSNSQVDRAGDVLRRWVYQGDLESPTPEEMSAIETAWQYRAGFTRPLVRVNVNLRYYVGKVGCEIIVAQRLKRLPRIVGKLLRQPTIRLSQMQDVGGCRAVLPDQGAVEEVLRGIRRNWDIITADDYSANPKPTGYRATHVIVRKEGRAIEVQLRTVGQQDWAEEVERIDGKVDFLAKDGEGPEAVTRYFRLLSEVIAGSEAGVRVSLSDLQELNQLRVQVP